MLTGQTIKCEARCTLGENRSVQRNIALENKGVREFLCGGRLPKVQRSCRVCSAVKILSARVTEVDGSRVNDGACPALRFVVDDSGTKISSECAHLER